MTEEKTERLETTETEESPIKPTIERVRQSAQELVARVRETVITFVRVGIDRTATTVERSSAQLTQVAERLHGYADSLTGETATNAEG